MVDRSAVPMTSLDRDQARSSMDSTSSASTTSLVFERLRECAGSEKQRQHNGRESDSSDPTASFDDEHMQALLLDPEKDVDLLESGRFSQYTQQPASSGRFRKLLWLLGIIFLAAWLVALVAYLQESTFHHASADPHDPAATVTHGHGKKITLDEIMQGRWQPKLHDISWIGGPNGEDGFLLEQGAKGEDYLVVKNVNGQESTASEELRSKTLMKQGSFEVNGRALFPQKVFPSKDLKKILIATNIKANWRHSYYALYWIFDVATQTAEPLDPDNIDGRVQLASWSPQSDAIVFTRDSNMFLRKLSLNKVVQMTDDGGTEYFYGVPDWVYEEEVFQHNSATWWAQDGKYIALMRTNETEVPEYPVQYFLSRPSGTQPPEGEENYPEVREIKYPKAGAPNPTVDLLFYDVEAGKLFQVDVAGGFDEQNLLITEVLWAGATGKVIIRETNRESDMLRIVLVDVIARTGETVRVDDAKKLDGGWVEITESTRYIPADPAKGRPHDGYIETIIHGNGDHLAYFTPVNNAEPILLTSGDWEVIEAPSAIDLDHNLVYFMSTKESSIQRHVYSVKLDGSDLKAVTDTSKEGYYGISFSSGAGYALVNYLGPDIPNQKIISMPSTDDHYELVVEENKDLADMARKHELPLLVYSTVNIDGFELNVVERRPPHFNPKKKYPVLFQLYNGPGAQEVKKTFRVDFQSYIAGTHDYIVVTLDGRGTGFIGRKARTIVRDNLGYWESHDQIATAKIWAKKSYVDSSRLAVWGWSYGGFMTLKILEQDAGETFQYGMAVAPVTDWRFYDSIYTERYMHTPQNNPGGYENASISDTAALQKNVRFLIMHGVSDDNVHYQNTLTLLDKLDLGGVENYDVHFFPDSNHGIYFHNANRIVYDKLNNWLTNAFNGEWLRTANAKPLEIDTAADRRRAVPFVAKK